jgi:hypothetical protein
MEKMIVGGALGIIIALLLNMIKWSYDRKNNTIFRIK